MDGTTWLRVTERSYSTDGTTLHVAYGGGQGGEGTIRVELFARSLHGRPQLHAVVVDDLSNTVGDWPPLAYVDPVVEDDLLADLLELVNTPV